MKYRSPPTRAEWIEIIVSSSPIKIGVSPPTRAEWIEILYIATSAHASEVSAHTGGVD